MLQIGDSVLISPYLTMCETWINGVVIDVENCYFCANHGWKSLF